MVARHILFVLAVLSAQPAIAAESDAALRQKIIGLWMPKVFSASLKQRNVFPLQKLNPDGTGGLYVFKGSYCGVLVMHTPMHWEMLGGALVEKFNWKGKPTVASGKVLLLDAKNFVQGDTWQDSPSEMVRAPVCAIS
jgi:hypothetical protein